MPGYIVPLAMLSWSQWGHVLKLLAQSARSALCPLSNVAQSDPLAHPPASGPCFLAPFPYCFICLVFHPWLENKCIKAEMPFEGWQKSTSVKLRGKSEQVDEQCKILSPAFYSKFIQGDVKIWKRYKKAWATWALAFWQRQFKWLFLHKTAPIGGKKDWEEAQRLTNTSYLPYRHFNTNQFNGHLAIPGSLHICF